MKLYVLKANNSEEMEAISEELSSHKFKPHTSGKNFILMKKRRYGNYYVHILCLLIALFLFNLLIFVNVIYFAYSFLFNSPHVLITVETTGEDGEPLEFNSMEEVLEKANALF